MERIAATVSQNWLALLLLVAVVVAFLVFRTSPTELADRTAFDAAIRKGTPTVLEFYSNF